MAYYVVTLIARCAVLVEAENEDGATNKVKNKLAERKINEGDFETTKMITDEIDKEDLESYKNFDIHKDLTT